MAITRGDFLRSLGKSLPGLVASTGAATAAEALIRRVAQRTSAPIPPPLADLPYFERGSGEGNQVALTFDDGPVPGVTELILDELKKRDLRVTFFMIGRQVAAAPDLARRVLAAGHEIGNHTFTHPKLTELLDEEVGEELEKTDKVFSEMLGYKAAWFRPPFGAFRRNQAPLAAGRGLGVVIWDVDSEDWRDPSQTLQNIRTKTKAQSIILCHELSPTAACLGKILDHLQERGLQIVTISSLLGSLSGKQKPN